VDDSAPKPLWLRNTHLVAGMLVVVTALASVAVLQLRATSARRAAVSVASLSQDVENSIAAADPAFVVAAMHEKLLDAIDGAQFSSAVMDLREDIATFGPPAIDGDAVAAASYGAALRQAFWTVSRDAQLANIRTQQIQMGIVATGAIVLILLIRSVAAAQQAAHQPRRTPTSHPSQIDPLTGLGRIDSVRDRLSELLKVGAPGSGFVGMLAVGIQPEHEHFLPLTRLQLDAALVETTTRLRKAVRATDFVARLARDELAVALPVSPRVEDPGRVASKVLGALDAPIVLDGVSIRPNPRVGIAISPLDAVTPDGLIERARLARRAASDSPAAVYRSYSENLAPTELGTLQMLEDLRAALAADDGQLWVAYQPKIDLRTERVVGFEALARWDHPRLGRIGPADFIQVAEESDLILELGTWVLDSVCAQLANWRSYLDEPIPVSVNVSSRQFEGTGIASVVRAALAKHDIPAELLELELTETMLLEDRQDLVRMMNDLSDLGVKIAIDDFGTGYSALSYLKQFPIDVLKIDRAFIREIGGDDGDEAISTAIISMAHSMALQVVAEGVETPEQLSILRTLGCDAAQGFYFAHPAPPAEIRHRTTA